MSTPLNTSEPTYRDINAGEFKALLKGDIEKVLTIRDCRITEFVMVRGDDLVCSGLVLLRCEFEDDLSFEEVNFQSGLRLDKTSVKGHLSIDDCRASEVKARGQLGRYGSFSLTNCSIRHFHLGYNTDIFRGLIISSECELGDVTIDGAFSSDPDNKGVHIVNSKVSDYIDIQGLTSVSRIRIARCTVNGTVSVHKCQADSLTLNSTSEFFGQFKLKDSEFGKFVLEKGTWQEEFEVSGLSLKSDAYISSCTFKKEATLDIRTSVGSADDGDKWQLGRIALDNIDASKEFSIWSDSGVMAINSLEVSCSSGMKGAVRFSDAKVDYLNVTGSISSELTLTFERCQFQQVNISRFNNSGHLSFLSCRGDGSELSQFSTLDANLGDTEFMDFHFNSFQSISITMSWWADIRYAFTAWFEDRQLDTNVQAGDWVDLEQSQLLALIDETNKLQSTNKREIYRQLKHASERQGDRVQALEFKARELQAFWNQVRLREDWRSSNYWILRLNWTNNHGQNWVRPICISFGVTMLFYAGLITAYIKDIRWFLGISSDDITNWWSLVFSNLTIFWQMFNPARRTDLMLHAATQSGTLSASVYFLETLHRIILAFLIFQTISAFRKFVK